MPGDHENVAVDDVRRVPEVGLVIWAMSEGVGVPAGVAVGVGVGVAVGVTPAVAYVVSLAGQAPPVKDWMRA